MRHSILLFIAFAFLMIACESPMHFKVQVLDAASFKPIDSAIVVFGAGKNGDFTKSGTSGITGPNGEFNGSFMIGCSFGCYEIKIDVNKKGYLPFTLFNPRDTIQVMLQPE